MAIRNNDQGGWSENRATAHNIRADSPDILQALSVFQIRQSESFKVRKGLRSEPKHGL